MIVPMKKVSLIIMDTDREKTLKKLRKMGVLHIEISEGSGAKLTELNEQAALLESGIFAVSDKKNQQADAKKAGIEESIAIAGKIAALADEKNAAVAEISALTAELERLKSWGEIDTEQIQWLAQKNISLAVYEMPADEYEKFKESAVTIVLGREKKTVRLAAVETQGLKGEETEASAEVYRLQLPQGSTAKIRQDIAELQKRIQDIDGELKEYSGYVNSMKAAVAELNRQIEFETYRTGMESENLSENPEKTAGVAYFTGYIPAEESEKLKTAARENAWGLTMDDPTPDDDAPTELRNNKFVSLIYPLTDFLGTVPGYFEYDISGWFLGFILIFFGIIFGDGGYGLIICAAAGIMLFQSYKKTKTVSPAFVLVFLLGAATVLWGIVTCTWFGLAAEQVPVFLQKISIPVLSNVNADKIWYPFWTNGEAGLTTSQNVQIFCFVLALVQLTVAHILVFLRNRGSLKMLGDIGSILQLVGMFYLVLSLVVNGQVFTFGLVIGGIPVGTVAIALIAIGFTLSFIFSNYEGSIAQSVLESVKNIVSVLLGVVNVFSDIVSYIRLWAVGLAGAAISSTVNDLAGPMLGSLMFMVIAIILLVFGHGLNMILNVLSVIVHGVRLNTLEFSTHLDMSWSGHKFKPFRE